MEHKWLKTLREQSQITQEDLTARLQVEGFDISRSSLASWESGRYEPPLHDPEFRRALSRALRVNVRTILRLAGYEVDDQQHSLFAEKAAILIDQLPEDKQELAVRLIEQIART
jgi:transcriptional regulator with XRE-family HTH domain